MTHTEYAIRVPKAMTGSNPTARASVITPPGEGGIGIVALSGSGAADVLQRCFRGTRRGARDIPSGAIAHGRIMRGEATVDEVIVAHLTTSSVDRYEVKCPKKTYTLFFDMYHCGTPKPWLAPKGFTRPPRG